MGRPTIILLVSLIQLCSFSSSSSSNDHLHEGSSLSVDTEGDVLTSSDGIFSAGFHPVGQNAHAFAIWFNKPSCSDNCTVVWMANRDYPVNGRQSKLTLTRHGNLVLIDAGRITVWATDTVSHLSPAHLKLYDSGNLVLHDSTGATLWQSFDSPTDTLLPLQQLKKHDKLVSSRSRNNRSSGFFNLYFDSDNVLSLLYKGPEVSSIYWPSPWLLRWEVGRSTNNNSRIAVLDHLGKFSSTDNYTIKSADYGTRIHRRLTIDFDGNVRLYSLNEREDKWVVSWQAYPRLCKIHGTCGPNSVCSSSPKYGRKCSCIPGYRMKNHTDWSFGCEPDFDLSCNGVEAGFISLRHTEFYGYEYAIYTNHTVEMCKNLCLEQCNCKGFQFRFHKSHQPYSTYCYLKSELRNGYHEPFFDASIYLKLPKTKLSLSYELVQDSGLECSVQVEQLKRTYHERKENEPFKLFLQFLSKNTLLWSTCAIGGIEFLIIFLVWFFLIRTQQQSDQLGGYHLIAATGFRRFTYAELEKSTNGFRKEIGRGAGGIVYKGKLSDDRIAAIKKLMDANHGEAEFLAEVNTIGKLNHMNLIDLWGYCVEGKHRLLVYEYMEHGSLAENLSSKTLDWEKRFQIALGTAKGLAYLHEECLEWILHCDIKPQNILIDSNYQPKVSDFGLSWLLNRGDVKNSKISRLRGTRGYMAPEWVLNMPITSKVDVYSYGIVLLELVTGRSHSKGIEGERTLIKWVKETMDVTETWMEKMVDPTLEGQYDTAEMSVLLAVALRCVEEDKDARPTMGEVVLMLLQLEEKH
ncbi:hypothetical protein V6N13_144071 [Hibiscus sabdariffa]|uniref:Receptor-like serine/threonine-protein kinase n=1 Tax=Hibiscus sabdariffa TaxID=183260 RepID=A0ABR2FJA6_9ROSI